MDKTFEGVDDLRAEYEREAQRRERDGREDAPSLRLLTVNELMMQPRPLWTVRDVLIQRGLGIVYGEPGSGKSFLALDLGACIVRGIAWFGHRVTQSSVAYFSCEGSLRARIEAYLQHHRLAGTELDGLFVRQGALDLLDPHGDVGDIIEAIGVIPNPGRTVGAIVVDTLNRAMPGGNENASEDMGRVIAAAKRIQDTTGAAVLLVHHSGKDARKGSRGHSSLKGAADLEIEVTNNEAGERCAAVRKVKDHEDGERLGFRLVHIDLGPSSDPDADPGERDGSCVVEPAAAPAAAPKAMRRDVALDALREAIGECGEKMAGTSTVPAGVRVVKLDQWRARWALRTGYEDSTGNSIAVNFHKDKDALLKANRIAISKPYVWLT